MSSYVISYNPYQNKTIIEKDGSQLLKNSAICVGLNGKRLQTWFDETSGWPGIGQAIDEDNNESKCEIVFKGREIDYLDLKEYFLHIYKSKRGTEFLLSAEQLSSDEDMLARLSGLIEEAEEKNLFPGKQISELKEHIDHLKKKPFVISVIATMSSGKSTLLNAFLHKELLPTGDPGTTANIVEIYDNDRDTIEYETFDGNGKSLFRGENADLETLQSINTDHRVRTVKIHTDIPMVSIGRMPLMLRDTPGPNNAGDMRHGEITESIISNARDMSTVLYIMNATQLEVESDHALLKTIAAEMERGGKQAKDRFLFVINRVDDWIMHRNQTLEGLLNRTKEYLKQFGIDSPRLFPVTASLASGIWRYRNGCELSKKEERDFNYSIETFSDEEECSIKFDQYASTSKCVERELANDLSKAVEADDKVEMALIHSGVKGLEYTIREYMEKYAYPIAISEAVEDIVASIDEKTMRVRFRNEIESDEHKLDEVKSRLKEANKKKEERNAKKEEFEKSIASFDVSEDLKTEAKRSLDEAYTDLIDKYQKQIEGKSKLRQDEAERIYWELQSAVKENEEKLGDKLDTMIQKEIYENGTAILEEYRSYIRSIEETIKIGGFDFRKVKDLKKSEFDSIQSVVDEVTSTEQLYTEKTIKVKNPKYRRFLFIHWGGDEYETKTEKIKTGTVNYVDKERFLNSITGIKLGASRNIDSLLAETSKLIHEFKQFFTKEMDKFQANIDTVLEEIEKDTEIQNITERSKEEHKKTLEELDSFMNRINAVTDF